MIYLEKIVAGITLHDLLPCCLVQLLVTIVFMSSLSSGAKLLVLLLWMGAGKHRQLSNATFRLHVPPLFLPLTIKISYYFVGSYNCHQDFFGCVTYNTWFGPGVVQMGLP